MATASIAIATPLEPEERLRADLYALFARLFVGPTDAGLLRLIASSPLIDGAVADSPFVGRWSRLCAAASVMDPAAAADEYDALFGGIGHSEISLFASHYVGEGAPGAGTHFLVALRAALARDGIGRKEGENMPEDHLSALLESMRLFIEDDAALPTQHAFFETFVAPWYGACCSAIASHRLANFYKTVAECVREFLVVETQSFQVA